MIGEVREWHDEQGWGVLTAPGLDSPVWAHFSAIEAEGYRTLAAGARVEFTYEDVTWQDGYTKRAVRVHALQT
ncbi:cold-shock protein [Allokutzneria oryzae]|uniref:Cold-shock protein n=1 Tax=Allokutzneria oryzae TaxID=1378989 RepID=A0ABV6A190_9PSEU